MEILTLLLIFIILFVLISFKSEASNNTGRLEAEIRKLQDRVDKLSKMEMLQQKPAETIKPKPQRDPEWQSGFKVEDLPVVKDADEAVVKPFQPEEPTAKEAAPSIAAFAPSREFPK